MLKNKKGSMMLEFVVVLPFLMFCLWIITNTMFFINAQSTVHQAAIMSAEVVSQEMRGQVTGVEGISKNPMIANNIRTNLYETITRTTRYNSLVKLAKEIKPEQIQFSNTCDLNTLPAVCVSSSASEESKLEVGVGHDIVEVRIAANFEVIGGFKVLFQNAKVNGYGYAALDQAERFNYQRDYN